MRRQGKLACPTALVLSTLQGTGGNYGAAEHAGEPLSRYEVRIEADTGELRSIGRPRLFGTSAAVAQSRLFELDALGEAGWLKALRLEGYAPRRPRGPLALCSRRSSPTRKPSDRAFPDDPGGCEHSDPPRPGPPRIVAPHTCGVAAASASTRASSSGRESMGWWSAGSSTTRSALRANSRCASGGVALSSVHTT